MQYRYIVGADEMDDPGRQELWRWFALSYAEWLTLPRSLMHAMPDEWQGKMAALLDEFSEEFPFWTGDIEYRVTAIRNGRFVPLPEWTSRAFYRHPNEATLDRLRKK
jgi:hypothetical protein